MVPSVRPVALVCCCYIVVAFVTLVLVVVVIIAALHRAVPVAPAVLVATASVRVRVPDGRNRGGCENLYEVP